MLKRSVTLLSLLCITFLTFGQSIDDAGATYNEANELYKASNYAAAIIKYTEAAKICSEVGPEADDLKSNILPQLANSYYKNGLVLIKAKKYNDALAELDKARVKAKALGNVDLENDAIGYIAKVRISKGNSQLKKDKFDEALAEYDKALAVQPGSAAACYGKGLVYKSKGDMEQMKAMMDQAIENGSTNSKEAKYIAKAKSAAFIGLLNEGAKEIQNSNGTAAADYINASFNYGEGNADSYYYLCLAYNLNKNWDLAVDAAQKSLELKEGDPSDIYFSLGRALEGKGDAAAACDAYKKVSGGANVELAKYQITTVLKCN